MLPRAQSLRFSQLADHVGTYVANIGSVLIAVEEARGQPSTLVADGAEIQRLVAERHGAQRARLGWTSDALERESAVLQEEVERAIRRCFTDPSCAPQVDEALGVVKRYLEQSAESSRRAIERALHRGPHRRAE
jgi:hypothetical protein